MRFSVGGRRGADSATPKTKADGSLTRTVEAGDLYVAPPTIVVPANNDVKIACSNIGTLQHVMAIGSVIRLTRRSRGDQEISPASSCSSRADQCVEITSVDGFGARPSAPANGTIAASKAATISSAPFSPVT